MKRKNILKALVLGDCKMSKAKSKKNDSKYPWKYTPFFTEGMPEDLDYLSILGMYRKVCKWLKLGTGLQSEWQAG